MELLTWFLVFAAIAVLLYVVFWTDIFLYWSDPIKCPPTEFPRNVLPPLSQSSLKREDRFLVIGSGFTGLAMMGAFCRNGIEFEAVDKNDKIGGNWYNGVYDSTHIISSRKTTQFRDFLMPEEFGDFPSAKQMFTYFHMYADYYRLWERIEMEKEVTDLKELPQEKYQVTIRDVKTNKEETRVYKGVIICNGHHWDCRIPQYKNQEKFAGQIMHSKQYKNPEQIRGLRVLVVGGGNSACDVASEAAKFAKPGEAHISLRRGYWFLPRTFLGIPFVEIVKPWLPMLIQRWLAIVAIKVAFGGFEKYGLTYPDHSVFEHHPTINSELLNYLRLGDIKPHNDIQEFTGGKTILFKDGSQIEVDVVIFATGYYTSVPLIKDFVESSKYYPKLIHNVFVPHKKRLCVVGLSQPRYGAGPLLTSGAEYIARAMKLQDTLIHPVGDIMAAALGPNYPKPTNESKSPDILLDPHIGWKSTQIASKFLVPLLPTLESLFIKLGTLQPCKDKQQ